MKLTAIALVVLFSLGFAALAAPQAAKMATASGQVAVVDTAASSVTVSVQAKGGDPKDVIFVVAADSKIVKNGAAIPLGDLKTGDKVTVTYRAEDGKNVVVNLGVTSKA
jgi:Cu/Ag efflux protein CusF